jgi:DNA-binding CsgD family transcriptional regulator
MPNRNKRGRPVNKKIRERVIALRRARYSNQEIANLLKISRQLAVYYGKKLSTNKGVDKKIEKNKIK